jgi:hypothetical protein
MEDKFPELRGITISELLEEVSKGENNLRECLITLLSKRNGERYVREKLVYRAFPEARQLLKDSVKQTESVDGLEELLKQYLSLDSHWIIAVSCFAAADAAIQRKAASLGIVLKRQNGTPRNSRELLDDTLKSIGGRNTHLKIFNVLNVDYRNEVIHKGTEIDEVMQRRYFNIQSGCSRP